MYLSKHCYYDKFSLCYNDSYYVATTLRKLFFIILYSEKYCLEYYFKVFMFFWKLSYFDAYDWTSLKYI